MSSPVLRVGAVSYLNTRPLIYGWERFVPRAELVLDYPSVLADDLARGALDVALIPSIEFLRDPSYTVVSDACIACRGPVLSVKLLSRCPAEKIRSLALDQGSRTSAALAQILLGERFGVAPDLVPLPLEADPASAGTDATLLIGDRAMHSPPGRYELIWDLGDQWCRWTGLPFVFAMWVARGGSTGPEFEAALAECRDAGLAHLPEIADREAASLGLTSPQCLAYLRDNLHFHFGPREQRGLSLFYEHVARRGLVPPGVVLGRSNCPAVG
jgi:chorismate dehydratase